MQIDHSVSSDLRLGTAYQTPSEPTWTMANSEVDLRPIYLLRRARSNNIYLRKRPMITFILFIWRYTNLQIVIVHVDIRGGPLDIKGGGGQFLISIYFYFFPMDGPYFFFNFRIQLFFFLLRMPLFFFFGNNCQATNNLPYILAY